MLHQAKHYVIYMKGLKNGLAYGGALYQIRITLAIFGITGDIILSHDFKNMINTPFTLLFDFIYQVII